jgi:Tol biopolymer transport system component
MPVGIGGTACVGGRRASWAILLLAFLLTLTLVDPSLAGTATTERVSVGSDGAQGNNLSAFASISATGRFVAFESVASTLVGGDTNGADDIFVHDRRRGKTERVSLTSTGAQAKGDSIFPSISAKGRFVAFASYSNLDGNDTNGLIDVYIRDRKTGKTERVSVSSRGTQGNGFSLNSSVSAKGRFVAFQSSSNLVGNDTNDSYDIFVHDRKTGQTERVSVSSRGTQGNGRSINPSISSNGRFVSFFSDASNLVGSDTNGADDVFVHDRRTGQTERVSVGSDGAQGNNFSIYPFISAKGRFVAFTSDASNLVGRDTNGVRDAFVHDRRTGETERVSLSSGGAQGRGISGATSISAKGRFVAFFSEASDLVGNDTNGSIDVYVRDRKTGQTERVSLSSRGAQIRRGSGAGLISANGHFVAFTSEASNVVQGDTNGIGDVFVRGPLR